MPLANWLSTAVTSVMSLTFPSLSRSAIQTSERITSRRAGKERERDREREREREKERKREREKEREIASKKGRWTEGDRLNDKKNQIKQIRARL